MTKIIDDLLANVPLWLGQFTQSLTHPTQVLSEHLVAEVSPKPVQDGVSFLILSFAAAAVLVIAFPVASMTPLPTVKPDGALTQTASVLRNLFVFLGAAAVVHGASKLFGVQREFAQFFGAVARFGGATLVLLALASAVTNIGMADPIVARNWQELRQVSQAMAEPMQAVLCKVDAKTGQLPAGTSLGALNPESLQQAQALYLLTTDRPMYRIGSGIQLAILTYLIIWLGWVWWRYLKTSGLSAGRAVAATAVGAAGLGVGHVLLVLIDAGQMLSQMMQRC